MAEPEVVSALIGLGSNLGDREGHLRRAAERLGESTGARGLRISDIRETAPVGAPGAGPLGGPYLNAAAELLTLLSARSLLDLCLEIESELGRVRTGPASPRTIDLDLLLYGDRTIEEPGLVVPHPRLLERGFVLEPLAELAPERVHPRSGRTLRVHWEEWRSLRDRDR